MNTPKLLLVAFAALVVLAAAPVFAQSTPDTAAQSASQGAAPASHDEQVQATIDHISSELNLTDDQKSRIKPILQSERAQLQTVHDDASMNPDQKKAKAKEIHASAKSEINTILNPDQQKKWAAMKESAKDK